MDLQITGTVTQILEEQSGESQRGPWRKQDFILETEGQYPREVCITQWGEKIEEFDVQEGETLTVHIDIESREYKGRWYTDVKAWRVEKEASPDGSRSDDPLAAPFDPTPLEGEEDLPF